MLDKIRSFAALTIKRIINAIESQQREAVAA